VATYRFQRRSAEQGWHDLGEQEIGRDTSALEAFDLLRESQSLPPGEYRFKRSDENPNHHWGQMRLTRNGEVLLGDD